MKRINKSQSGFSPLFLILILLLLLFIAFVWWYVLRRSDTASAPSSSVTSSSSAEEVTIPDGYQLYEDETLGFQFAYPETWGDVSVVTQDEYKEYHYTEGSLPPTDCPAGVYELRFSALDTVTASLLNKNCVPGPRGGGEIDIADFCTEGAGYALGYRDSEPIDGGSDYKATGTVSCGDVLADPVESLSAEAILIPSICVSEACLESSDNSAIMIRHSGLTDYPGFKIIDYSQEHNAELSTIAGTFGLL